MTAARRMSVELELGVGWGMSGCRWNLRGEGEGGAKWLGDGEAPRPLPGWVGMVTVIEDWIISVGRCFDTCVRKCTHSGNSIIPFVVWLRTSAEASTVSYWLHLIPLWLRPDTFSEAKCTSPLIDWDKVPVRLFQSGRQEKLSECMAIVMRALDLRPP